MAAFNIESLTMGELAAAQEASGLTSVQLIGPYRLMLAAFVLHLRNSGERLNWQELASRRILDISSGPQPSPADSQSPKSSE